MKNKMLMKHLLRALALTLCFVAALTVFASCGTADGGEKTGFSVTTEALEIKPDMAIDEVLAVLGSMYDMSESQACPPFSGTEKLYDFIHLQISTYEDAGVDRVMSIFFKDDSVDVSGVRIGSTVDELTEALGTKCSESGSGTYTYTADNGSTLKCIVKEGKVVSIRITTEKADS